MTTSLIIYLAMSALINAIHNIKVVNSELGTQDTPKQILYLGALAALLAPLVILVAEAHQLFTKKVK